MRQVSSIGRVPFAVVALLLLALTACRTGRVYPAPDAPRYAGEVRPAAGCPASSGDILRIVTFNIAYAERVDSALVVLRREERLRCPDILLLQEMDRAATERIAAALGMAWVYYPAVFHLRTERDFGNAVLSRWPIEADDKLLLPHQAAITGTRRIATAATIRFGATAVRVYSVHLATPLELGPRARREQFETVLDDAAHFPTVIIGGDLNSHGVAEVALAAGFSWPTEEGPRTTAWGRWDHVLLKGLDLAEPGATGTVTEVRNASDHRPVWVEAVVGGDPGGG